MTRVAISNYHSVEEHMLLQNLRGYEVISLGAYLDPANPGDGKRPALDIPPVPSEVIEACRDTHAAKQHYPDVLLEWLGKDGVLIVHHFLPDMFNQWARLKAWGGRVVWRSDGQSSPDLERTAQYYRAQGLERVPYSPRESNFPFYAGHDAVIRFGFDPSEWDGWTGHASTVINVTQNLYQRGSATNYGFWDAATKGLGRLALGPGSQDIGGPGELSFDDMKSWLRRARAYVYTGTQPASYTLGLIEAGMTGIPIVSIGAGWMQSPELFEAPDLVPLGGFDDPEIARQVVAKLLTNEAFARQVSEQQRAMFVANFGAETVRQQWAEFLG